MKHGTGTTDPDMICLSNIGFDPGYAYVSEYSANMLGKVRPLRLVLFLALLQIEVLLFAMRIGRPPL